MRCMGLTLAPTLGGSVPLTLAVVDTILAGRPGTVNRCSAANARAS